MLLISLVLVFLFSGSHLVLQVESVSPLYIAGFFPMSRNSSKWRVGLGVLPAVHQAIHDINLNKSILPEYELRVEWNDTKCDTGQGMKVFFDMIHNEPKKIALFGDVCTTVTDPIAKASKYWNIIQLSYGDTHPMYSKSNYPNLFRIVPSENEFNAPRKVLLQKYNWTLVGTFYQNQPIYSLAHNSLVKDLELAGIKVGESQSFADEIKVEIGKLKQSGVRIILGNFNETWARRIFCEAYKEKLYGRKYQWLIVAAYDPFWWRVEDTNCTLKEIEAALEGAILFDVLALSKTDLVTISGRTADEYDDIYQVVSMEQNSRFHGYAYDGVWALALALHNTYKYFGFDKYEPGLLNSFDYKDKQWENAILESLDETSFQGVTGPVKFLDNGRKGSVLIKQFQVYNLVHTEVKVGEYDSVTATMDLTKYKTRLMWKGGRAPRDRTIELIEHQRINLSLFIMFSLLACFGIMLACFFLAVNVKFRNQRYIKMSSPNLNNLIIIGCMFTYMSVIILGLDSQLTSTDVFPYICTGRGWILMAGFTLAFGSMFSKTWRVHSIFTNVKLNKKVIKDTQLYIVVGILLCIDFAIMTTWQILDPFYRTTQKMTKYPDPTDDDIEIIPEIEYCQSIYMSIFIGCIYTYKGLLMMFGCFLAWETRHVSIPALNDSKYIGMSVYNSVMMCIIGAPLTHILSDKQDIAFVIISIFIIFCTTATLCLVFLPKVIELRRNPKGIVEKRLRTTIKPTNSSNSGRRASTSLNEHELRSAKGVNGKYRRQIRDIDTEIEAIAKILGDEVKEILEGMLAIPSFGRREQDTDISSLYSMNSTDEHEPNVFFEEEEVSDHRRKSKLFEGLISNSMLNSAKTLLFAPAFLEQKAPSLIQEDNSLTKILEDEEMPPGHRFSAGAITPYTSPPVSGRLNKSEVDLAGLAVKEGLVRKKSESESELMWKAEGGSTATRRAAAAAAKDRRKSITTQDEIWMMLQKERPRYLDRNIYQPPAPPKRLKSPTIPKPGGLSLFRSKEERDFDDEFEIEQRELEEILMSENNHSASTTQLNSAGNGGFGGVSQPQPLFKYKSASVPRQLNNNGKMLELDVNLLPIFQKIFVERTRSLKITAPAVGRSRSKMMVSCPNIMIKCDIVEYL